MSVNEVLTADEVAALLRMKRSWVYAAARSGELPHVRLGRAVRFRRSAIDAYLDRLEAAPPPTGQRPARVRIY
jgi:excisionase family DNA binding protein